MRKSFLITLSLLFSITSWALPEKIEFIFLSEGQITSLIKKMDNQTEFFASLAMNSNDFECQPIDGGCFHPQLGFIEKIPEKIKEETEKKKDTKVAPLKTFNSLETSLVDCKEEYYFDVFCGKETKVDHSKKNGVEVWFDVSSSMRKMDYSKEIDYCARRTFAQKIDQGCGEGKIRFQVFNTSRKDIGEFSTLCVNHGLNDQDRLINWIKESKAKHLLVITDIDELSIKMRNFLDSESAVYHGSGIKDFTSHNLDAYADSFIKACKKI